jgi:hypothetical protein
VKKISRLALLVACALAGLLAAALLAVNLYVQAKGTQERIQQELSQRLGTTLRIRRISVTPWFGLKLTGITMPQGAGATRGDFLRADTFRLRIRLASLFARRLVINEISLINPNVVWAQNDDGQWRLPSAPRPEEPAAVLPQEPQAPAAKPGNVAIPSPANSAGAGAVVEEEANIAEVTARPFTPEVQRVNMTNGNFHFLDVKGKPVATFEGVGFRSSLRNSTELRGNASIARIALRNRFFLKNLKSPVKYDPLEIALSQITASAAGGEITGRFSLRPADEDSPFQAMVAFRDVQADRVVAEAGGPSGMVQGRIEGKLDATGRTADANALAGTGEIFLRDGEVRQFSLLVALGQLLQIDELTRLRLDQAQVKYHIMPGVVMIDELLLTSPNIRLSATGTVDFKGRLKLESQLAINEKIRGQLFGGMRESFRPIDTPGFAAVDFQVTGTLDRPKTNLMGKVVGRDLKNLGGVINSLLGGGKTERPKKQKPAGESPVVSPAPVFPAPLEAASPPESPSPPPTLPEPPPATASP